MLPAPARPFPTWKGPFHFYSFVSRASPRVLPPSLHLPQNLPTVDHHARPATVRSSIVLPVPATNFARAPSTTAYFHLHLHLRPLGTARCHLRRPIPNHPLSSSSSYCDPAPPPSTTTHDPPRRSPSSAKTQPLAVFQFRPSSISFKSRSLSGIKANTFPSFFSSLGILSN
jgi:hypothetical protein